MAVLIECCGQRYRVAEHADAEPVRCVVCGKHITTRGPVSPKPTDPVELTAQARFSTSRTLPPGSSAAAAPSVEPALAEDGTIALKEPEPARPMVTQALIERARSRPSARINFVAPQQPQAREQVLSKEGLIPILLVLFVAIHFLTCMTYSDILRHRPVPGISVWHQWLVMLAEIALFCGVVVPATLSGLFVAAVVQKVPLPPHLFLRSAALAALPTVLLPLALLYPNVGMAWLTVDVVVLVTAWYLLVYLFALKPLDAGVFLALGSLGFLAGQYLLKCLVIVVLLSWIMIIDTQGGMNNILAPQARLIQRADSSVTVVNAAAQQISAFEETLNRQLAQEMGGRSREDMMPVLDDLRQQAMALETSFPNRAELPRLRATLQQLEAIILSLPSGKVDPSIFQPLVPTEKWVLDPADLVHLSDEVSFGPFKFRPPQGMAPDPVSNEEFLLYGGGIEGRFSLTRFPRQQPRQLRPWMIKDAQLAQTVKGAETFYKVAYDPALAVVGTINGTAFMRIEQETAAATIPSHQVWLIAAVGDDWLVAEAVSLKPDLARRAAMEGAARSLRLASPGEPRSPVFTPASLAATAMTGDDRVVTRFLATGAEGEAAVLPYLKTEDPARQLRVLSFLTTLGTARSLPAVRELTKSSNNDVAAAAKSLLLKLNPTGGDPVDAAVATLRTQLTVSPTSAVQALRDSRPDSRKKQVVSLLERVLAGDPEEKTRRQAAADALASWSDSDDVPQLIDTFEQGDAATRDLTRGVLVKLRDPRAVPSLIKFYDAEPNATLKALVLMGPVAENDVMRLMVAGRQGAARVPGCQLLEQIGTGQSVEKLREIARDGSDPASAQAAKLAIVAINGRSGSH